MSGDDRNRGKRSKPARTRVESSGDRAVGVGGNIDHATVVTGDVGTFINYPPTRPALGPTLHQLPRDIADFTGRKREVSEVRKALEHCDGHGVISALNGMGGIGKTTLAVHVAHQWAERYPDAQIVVDMQGMSQPLRPIEAIMKVIQAFDPTAEDLDHLNRAVGIYRNTLAGKHALILLDNAADAEQVRPLVPPAPCALIVTSRRAIVLEGSRSINLNELSEEDALALLRELFDKHRATDQQLNRIADLCGHLPLALRVAGSFLAVHRDWTAHEYIEALADERKRLGHLKQDDLDVEAVLGLSAKQLEQENVELVLRWRMLGVIPTDFIRKTAAVIWNVAEEEARDSLSELLVRSLILFDGETKKYRLHDLVRLSVRSQLSDAEAKVALERYSSTIPSKLDQAQKRLADHYERVLHQANELYLQGNDGLNAALALFDSSQGNIKEGQRWAASHSSEDEEAANLCSDYSANAVHILSLRLYPSERIRWLEDALAAARRLESQSRECLHSNSLGFAYAELGEIHRAIEFYQHALSIAREIGNRSGEGSALDNLGQAYAALGETRRAIELQEASLAIAREVGDRRGEGNAVGNLGQAYAALGETRRAIELQEASLAIAREVGDRRGEGNAVGNLGRAYADLGETRGAIELYEQHLAIAREIGDRRGEGNALGNVGIAYRNIGQPRRAVEFYEQQLAIVQEIGDRRGQGNALFNMSLALDQLGEREEAIRRAEAALKIFEQIESPYVGNARTQLAEWREHP